MNPPMVYEVTMPKSQSTIRMTATVQSMMVLPLMFLAIRSRDRGSVGHFAMTIWFLTAFTPSTPLAMLTAVLLSVAFFANPESMTVPFSVSTVDGGGVDSLAVREFGLDLGRDRAVVDVGPGGLLAPVDRTARRREQYERRHGGGQGVADVHGKSPF